MRNEDDVGGGLAAAAAAPRQLVRPADRIM